MAARICLLSCAGFMLVLLLTYACYAADGEIIGQTSVFHLTPSAVLIANDPSEEAGVQAFNYFFCIELFFGLFAVWLKMLFSVFKREVI
jgi:hypothetical protein